MLSKNSPLPSPLFLISIHFILLLNFNPTCSSNTNNQTYFPPSCTQNMSCGTLTNITYPFWLQEDNRVDKSVFCCGYPHFMLTCENNTTAILNFDGYNYSVTDIHYDSHTVSVVDVDILESNDCPRVHHNYTLQPETQFNFTRNDINLTFFFNCTGISADLDIYQITGCFSGEYGINKQSYVFWDYSVDISYSHPELNENCSEIIVSPVWHDNVNNSENNLVNEFGKMLQRGFDLNWPMIPGNDSCGLCEKSGGRCGFSLTTNTTAAFTCFCADGKTEIKDCRKEKMKKKKRLGLIIGAAAASGVVLSLAVLFIIYKRKKRARNSPSSKSLIKDISFRKDGEYLNTHLFSYEELVEATNGFDSCRELGDGGFGTVYKGELRDGRIVAIKRLYENNYRRLEQFMNEVDILSTLRHQNLVDLYGCTSRLSRELLLVYEYVSNGTVADHLHGSRATEGILTWPLRLSIAIETADALAYLHAVNPQIIHRDVKTNNILLDSSFHVKVADFGLSRLFPTDVTHVSTAPQGTPGYVDPEYHQCYQLTEKSDVYSFGVVLVELISSKPAVDITRHRSEINLANMAITKIQNGEVDQLVDMKLGYELDGSIRIMINMVAELAFRCLQSDGDMRPPIKDVLETLRKIQGQDYAVPKKGDDEARTRDDVQLLKNVAPFSPDTVINNWTSRSTTPNTSG